MDLQRFTADMAGENVAIKVIKDIYASNRNSFKKELAAMALLAESQNIISLYGYFYRED